MVTAGAKNRPHASGARVCGALSLTENIVLNPASIKWTKAGPPPSALAYIYFSIEWMVASADDGGPALNYVHLSSCPLLADFWISRIYAMSIPTPSSLASSDDPDKCRQSTGDVIM